MFYTMYFVVNLGQLYLNIHVFTITFTTLKKKNANTRVLLIQKPRRFYSSEKILPSFPFGVNLTNLPVNLCDHSNINNVATNRTNLIPHRIKLLINQMDTISMTYT